MGRPNPSKRPECATQRRERNRPLNLVQLLMLAVTVALATGAAAQSRFPGGRPINMIVPFAAGGPTDVAARLLATPLEKELATSVAVVNKPGASTQLGVTQLVTSRPDGFTVGFVSLPQLVTVYMDPARKAVFARKDLQPLAMHVVDPAAIVVRADSPYTTLKQVLDAAKATPGKIKGGTGGFMGMTHLAWLDVERATDTKFALVHFEGSAPGNTALLGGHIDVLIDTVAGVFSRAKSGEFRVLGVMDNQDNPFMPGARTLESQGLKLYAASSRGLALPAGTPKDVVEIFAEAVRKVLASDEHRQKMAEMGQTLRYMSPAEFATYWADNEKQVVPLMEQAKATAAATAAPK